MGPPPQKDEVGPPGAGTYFVYAATPPVNEAEWDKLPTPQPVLTPSPDSLLLRGIADYSYVPRAEGGILGRGKFSTVYRVRSTLKDGSTKEFALKHTPLYPHHPLIAARLLREPTLLAQLDPHPCLIGVDGFVRTEGHFYLVEHCASTHVPLPKHPLPLRPSRAAYLLDQLVSVLRDGLHAGRVCHRDLKGDNVLIDVDTGDILLLDLGLATHFSASEPRLTTCCGSPAFHSPEIVNALNHRPGEVTYYGPEVDIWCIALTMLALLLQMRFPLGPTHTSRHIMRERALDRLQELDDLYPPAEPWRGIGYPGYRGMSDEERATETEAWKRVRRAVEHFVDIDPAKRMSAFAKYDVGDRMRARVEAHAAREGARSFKTTTFLPSEVKYTLPLYFDPIIPNSPIVLRNPSHEPERRILSYIKYLLRSAGILYHHVPDTHPAVLQLVLPLAPQQDPEPVPLAEPARDWMSSLLGLGKRSPPRSASVPAPTAREATPPPGPAQSTRGKKVWQQQLWLRIDVERTSTSSRSSHSRAPSRAGSRAPSRAPSRAGSRASSATRPPMSRAPSLTRSPEAELVPLAEGIVQNLSIDSSRPMTSEPSTIFPSLGDIVTPATTAAPKLHRPVPSPLSRVSSPAATTTALPVMSPPASPRPHTRRTVSSHAHTPRVTLTLTEPRGYELLRAALVVAVSAPRRGSDAPSMSPSAPPMSPLTRALAIPSSGSSTAGSASASDVDPLEEEERGRARSKDNDGFRGDETRSQTVRPGSAGTPQPRRRKALDAYEYERRASRALPSTHKLNHQPPRERKASGLLESIFGKPEAAALKRSTSVPASPRGDIPANGG